MTSRGQVAVRWQMSKLLSADGITVLVSSAPLSPADGPRRGLPLFRRLCRSSFVHPIPDGLAK